MTKYFYLSQYFECKQADIEWILIRCLNIIVFEYLAPEKGVGRVFILDFHVNVANDMRNLAFKGSLHILMNPILYYCVLFSFYIASSCNMTSV